jgi:DNA-binding XRE family transcriptional regulator
MNNLNIKEIRALMGLTQSEFAQEVGVSLSAVRLWERGETKPKLKYALKIIELDKAFNKEKHKEIEHSELMTSEYQPEGRIINEESLFTKQVAIIPVKGRGGLENAFYDRLYLNNMKKEELLLKEKSSEGSEWFKIEVEGVSMDDSTSDFEGSKYSLVEGDWAYCRSIPKMHWRNKLHFNSVKVFCFFHNTRGIIFKKVLAHDIETGVLLLSSINPDKGQFPDFEINISKCSYVLNVIEVRTNYN